MSGRKTRRNLALVRRYRAGARLRDLADEFGISTSQARRIVLRDAPELLAARRAAQVDRLQQPEARARQRDGIRRRMAERGSWQGRRRLFADNPDQREHYLILQRKMGAAWAREAMGLARDTGA